MPFRPVVQVVRGQLGKFIISRLLITMIVHRDLRRKPWPSGRGGIRCCAWRAGVLSVMTGML
jgi:hypothetical protein